MRIAVKRVVKKGLLDLLLGFNHVAAVHQSLDICFVRWAIEEGTKTSQKEREKAKKKSVWHLSNIERKTGEGSKRQRRADTRIEKHEKFEADVVGNVKSDLGESGCNVMKWFDQIRTAEQRQREQVKLLSIGQRWFVWQVIVQPLVKVIQNQQIWPCVLQQFHLIVNLFIFDVLERHNEWPFQQWIKQLGHQTAHNKKGETPYN